MNYAVLKTYIDTYIKENGNEEITGDILNAVLKRMTDDLGDYRFSGVIVPSSIAPQVTDINRWFITSTNGTYTNFGDIEVLDELAIITFDGTFQKHSVMSNYIPNILANLGVGAETSLPTTALDGDIYVSTDTLTIFTYSSGDYIETTISRGQMVTDTLTSTLYQYNGYTLETIKSLTLSGGGAQSNVYLTTASSTIVPSYKLLSYTAETEETILSGTANNNEVLIQTYLFDLPLNTTLIPPGMWYFNAFAKVDSAIGVTTLKFEVFIRHEDTTETSLFSTYSREINEVDYASLQIPYYNVGKVVLATDYLGIKISVKTTATTNKTISIKLGDGYASFFQTTLSLRHNQLRDLNADNNYLHVTSAEKDNWNNADARGRYLLTNEIEGVTSGGTYALVKNKANEINTYKLEAGTHNFNFDTPTAGITNDYFIDFQCGNSAPTIVWGVTIDWGTSVPTIEQSKRYEIIIKAKRVKNGSTYTWVYDGTWESHGTI